MNTLVIEKQTGGYFKFTLNGDTANAITSIQNDLLAVGTQLHFKTGNGANIIKEQFIYPADVTIIASGTFTFTTVAQVWDKLIDIDYFAWLGGGGTGGVDRFDDLLDTFSYTGNAGKAVVVDGSELRLVPITLYNKRLFTELEDTPSSLVPNKMLVVNPAGTAVVLQDQPEQPEQLLNSVGYFDYNDLITQTTPLNAVANVALKLTNDTEGANTSTDQNPYGVSYVWDYTTNQFNFNELEVGDTIDVRVHVQVTTTSANQRVLLSAKFGIGSVAEFTNIIYENQFKSAGLHEINFVAPFYMGATYITDNPAELYLTTDSSATVKVDGWYVRILRKNINIITVDYTVPDATTTVKGIVRLAGDLAGTANSPTVPELANKVPTSRTVSTTSPLLGGGALSSNLTLSIQQANSVDSGYLSNVDWSTFNGKANDNAVVKLTGDQSITGSKSFTTNTAAPAMVVTNNSTDNGILLQNTSTGNALRINNGALSTGDLIRAGKDGNVTFIVNQNGNTTAASFIKSGGTSSQFLKADGSVDSSTYALTSQLHDAVTIGSANGLSLSGQVLSLALASPTTRGALTSEDYNYFFDKVQGNGNQNYIPKYIFSGSNKVIGNSQIYDNGTNIGIGTNTPSQLLTLGGAANVRMTLRSTTTTGSSEIYFGDSDSVFRGFIGYQHDGDYFQFSTAASEKMRLTSNGELLIGRTSSYGAGWQLAVEGNVYAKNDLRIDANASFGGSVGIGVTPQVWDSAYKVLQVSDASFVGNADELLIGHNLYRIGEDVKYISSSRYASLYSQNSGAHWFATAPIGTAGANATLTTRMILTNDGKLGIGTTSPFDILDVRKNQNTTTNFYFQNTDTTNTSSRAYINLISGSQSLIFKALHTAGSYIDSSSDLYFQSANSVKMTMLSNGNLGIGTTSPGAKLEVVGNIKSSLSGYEFQIYPAFDTNVVGMGASSNHNLAIVTNATERMRITSGGNVGIGTDTDAGYKLDVNGKTRVFVASASSDSPTLMLSQAGTYSNIAGAGDMYHGLIFRGIPANYTNYAVTPGDYMSFYEYGGDFRFYKKNVSELTQLAIINSTGITATGFFNSSDIRLKDITDYDYNVSDIKPITYLWKDGRDNKKHVGYSAQEVQKVMPDAVKEDDKGFLSVNYIEVLVAKIAELENRIKQLEK